MADQKKLLTDKQLENFRVIANLGLDNATKAIAEMTNLKVTAKDSATEVLSFSEIPTLVGGSEEDAVGVYLQISGDISGHILLLWDYASACRLTDVLMENPEGTTTSLDEIGESAVKEVGNMVGSFFLNAMSDFMGLRCNPSPPAIIIDMMGAIVNFLSSQVAVEGDCSLVIDTTFKEGSNTVIGNFMLIPSASSLGTLLSKLENETI